MQVDGRFVACAANHRDHLPKAQIRATFNETGQEIFTNAFADHKGININGIFDGMTIGRTRTEFRRVGEAANFAFDFRDNIRGAKV